MKILFVEDTDSWVKEFLPQLQTIGDVFHTKSYKGAQLWLKEHLESLDLIVCNHHILFWEDNNNKPGLGSDLYKELRRKERNKKPTPFIHFSATPCPEFYTMFGTNKDNNFFSKHKKMV